MKPSTLIKNSLKTQKARLRALESLVDYFCGEAEAKWAIEQEKHGKT
jgi:hypothetical protein